MPSWSIPATASDIWPQRAGAGEQAADRLGAAGSSRRSSSAAVSSGREDR
jgi:hypothetical protein